MSEYGNGESLIEELVTQLSRLPSVGKKTAQRLAFHLLSEKPQVSSQLAQALVNARQKVHPCGICGNYTEKEVCAICASPRRNTSLLCVVEKPADVLAFEKSGGYQGLYHVLGGSISPLEGVGPEELNLPRLFERCQAEVKELILALNTNSDGEATALYITGRLRDRSIRVTRLARGIPVGSELEYVDELTVQRALEGRVEVL